MVDEITDATQENVTQETGKSLDKVEQ